MSNGFPGMAAQAVLGECTDCTANPDFHRTHAVTLEAFDRLIKRRRLLYAGKHVVSTALFKAMIIKQPANEP